MAGRLRPQTAPRSGPLLRNNDGDDADSIASFQTSPSPTKASARLQTWTGNAQVDHDAYHKMVEEHRAAKQKQQGDELKIRQLAAQLARTEEAAKRALVRTDPGAKGSTAQALLDAQRQVQQLQGENSELCSKLARQQKRAAEFRASSEDYRRRMEAAQREQRALVRKLGETERSLGGSTAARTAARNAATEQEFWSQEAGRRFAVQQEELVALREANQQLQQQLAAAVPADTAVRYESAIRELQQMVQLYEQQLAASGLQAAAGGAAAAHGSGSGPGGAGSSACGRWLLESLTEGGACYLWEPATGRVFSDPPEGEWPRPVGLKQPDAAGGMHLGVRGRLDAAFRALADVVQHGSSSSSPPASRAARSSSEGGQPGSHSAAGSSFGRALTEGLRQLLAKGQAGRAANSSSSMGHAAVGATVDVRDVPALLSLLLPGLAHKEAAELAAWLCAGTKQQQQQQQQQQPQQLTLALVQQQQQHMSLAELETYVREMLHARDAVRQGREAAVAEALLRVRRLLRGNLTAVAAAFEGVEGQDGCLSGLQLVHLLQQEVLLADLSPDEACHLLALLHEWDLGSNDRHSLTDVYAALQLLTLVRVPPGALSVQHQEGGGHWQAFGQSGVVIPERPDSRSSTATTLSHTTSTMANVAAAGVGVGRQPTNRPGRTQQPGRRGGAAVSWEGDAAQAGTGQSQSAAAAAAAAAGHGPSLREVYLRERVAALEAELAAAASRGSVSTRSGVGGGGSHSHGGASSGEVDQLRAELGRYQARLAELENDFLSLDVVANTELTEYDAEMRKAWFTAAAFKKRYVEHKTELDTIKATADKMQAALDDTHRALQVEAARRMALEEAVAVARAGAGHAKELAASVAAERAERLKLEKEYLELQGHAFAAPGGALAEVRQLREELLAARRERAVAEGREAELRREIASLKRQLEGVSPEEHRRLVRELAQAEHQCSTMELELRAALDKLDVYRWADDAARCGGTAATQQRGGGSIALAALSGGQPDDEKSAEELRAELGQLRQAMALQGDEAQKLRKLLDTEASISLEAKAALEEAQSALSAAKAEAGQQLAKLRRELDSRDEQIGKLESRLRAAYAGVSHSATRASAAATPDAAATAAGAVRISRVGLAASSAPVQQSLDDALEALAPHENVIEVLVSEASLAPAASLAPDATTFVAWSFYLHDSQATPGLPGHEPSYDTTVRYIVEADAFLLEYLSTQSLAFELFEACGWEVRPLGTAHLRLATLLEDLQPALGGRRAWHQVDLTGAGGQVLGRLRVGFRVAKPLDRLLLEQALRQQKAEESQRDKAAADGSVQVQPCIAEGAAAAACPEQQGPPPQAAGDASGVLQALTQAAKQAAAEPSQASHLLITIHRCEGLPTQQHSRWYAHYNPPGRATSHDTAVAGGASPVFGDAASWALVRSAALNAALEQHMLQVAVFDDAVEDPSAALLGLASVPCAALVQGIPVEGAFGLVHPSSGDHRGRVWLSIKWHNPLAAAAVGARPLQLRVPLADAAAAAAVTSSSVAAAAPVQQEQPVVQQMDWPQLLAQQQLQQQLLPSVPMLTATHLQQQQLTSGHAPSMSPVAAAAVAAAFARGQQQQQPLMLAAPPPGNPLAAFSKAPGGTLMLLQPHPGQPDMACGGAASTTGVLGQPPNLRYGGVQSLLQQSLEGLPLSAAQSPLLPATRQQQVPPQQLDQGSSSSSQAQAVLMRVLPNPEAWGSLDTTIFFRVECLALSEDALADPAIAGRHVLLAHMLLEDFTSPVQQCTETALVTGPQPLAFSYAAAYSIADAATKAATPAGRALAAALAAAEVGAAPALVLPVLLACSPTATVADFSQVECVASCELRLSELWAGTSGDVISRQVALFPAAERAALYPSGCVGQLRVMLVAARALQTLKQQCG